MKDLGNVCLAPKGKWSKEQEYERLALVYNACNNLSYVAKINVPIGVEIDNREYWQPMNATGYADNNFINLTAENENGTITAYENIEEAIATIVPVNRKAGATLSFYNLNSDRLDRQAEFELWQFNSTDLANWENKDYWNNIYYNWNVFAGWYIDANALTNHVETPNVGQYAYVGSNLNDAILYQCRTNDTWTNTGIKVRNYISVVEATLQHANYVIEHIEDYKNQVTRCEEMLKELNPQFAKDKARDERIAGIETEVAGIKGDIAKILAAVTKQ